jgi:hypothetical protein
MGIFSWLLPRDRTTPDAEARRALEAAERVATLSPQLRLASHYQARLAQAARVSLDYVGSLVESFPAAREASASEWSADPHIHAFFATADDVALVFSRSPVVREYFDEHVEAEEAFALLGMAISERRMFGVKEVGGLVHTDVATTTISFSDHRVRLCAGTEADLRDELVLRIVDHLALAGLAQIEADASRRDALEEERALLKARLRMLERGGVGMNPVLGLGATVDPVERATLQAQIEANEHDLAALGVKTGALERQLGVVCDVLADPVSHLTVVSRQVRLDRMNRVVDDDSDNSALVEFRVARVPGSPPRIRAFALARVKRSDLLPAAALADDAKKLLV